MDLEIPLGKRTKQYRFFEMLPAMLSYGSLVLLITLSIFYPTLAAVYLLIVASVLLIKAVGIAIRTVQGSQKLTLAQKIDWHQRLDDLSEPAQAYSRLSALSPDVIKTDQLAQHILNLKTIKNNQDIFPKPMDVYNAVIVATYNESYDVICPTIQAVLDNTYNAKHIILTIAYEERGGVQIEKTVKRIQSEFKDKFYDFLIVKHPKDLPNEVIGKGGNITYAGNFLKKWLKEQRISYDKVIVTTLDSDNRPHKYYFDYLTYEYIIHPNRKFLAYQPLALFTNNIWDVPAPMRVIATGNSFWNIISSMRPYSLRNFASHSQPMDALVEMGFWSTRTIVEDGHQYWRSYFFFNGNYSVLPLYIPIYQDAVLSDTYRKTLKAQFIQLRRWAYGASDVPYVAVRVFGRQRTVPFVCGVTRFLRLLDGHVTLASVSILVAFGGWTPLLVSGFSTRNVSAHQLPEVISQLMSIAVIGMFVTVFLSFKILPPRPERYKKSRSFFMITQWVLMPVTSVVYSALSALYSQGRLFTGRYLDKFDVTEKVVVKK